MSKVLNWLDRNILKISVMLLILFIPLYPKFPLLDIKYTWVYIRLDDLAIALVTLIFGVQLLRRKATLHTPITLPIIAYWIAGLLTTIFALLFVVGHIPNIFSSLVILHYLRRVEYMIVFFIAFNSVRSNKDLSHFITALSLVVLGVSIYAIGQRLAGLPAIMTMNEEFAKGKLLYLPPTARITSTFAGHYDLAAYMVLVIPIIVSVIFAVRRWSLRIALFVLGLFAYTILLFTESRVSIAAYFIAISLILWFVRKRWLILPVLIVSVFLMNILSGSSERFYKTFRIRKVAFNLETGQPVAAIKGIEEKTGTAIAESQEITKEKLPVGTGFIGLPVKTAPYLDSGRGTSASQKPKRKVKKERVEIRQLQFKTFATQELAATGEAKIATVSGKFLIRKALVYDISFTTRFQGEWPRAIEAFKRNPILGSGFSTVSLATDNDYLRMLGESGVLGTIAFLLIFFALGTFIYRAQAAAHNKLSKYFASGVSAGVVGLALNAIFIDVFEASKVAYTLWIVIGLAIGGLYLFYPKKIKLRKELTAFFTSPPFIIIGLVLISIIFFHPLLNNYFVGDDYTWLRWAAESNFEDLILFFTRANGFFYRPLQRILYLIMFNVFWLIPHSYHLVSLGIHIGIGAGVFLLALVLTENRWRAAAAAVVFLFLASGSESIFWISSLGNQLGTFFMVWALYLYIHYRKSSKILSLPLAFISSMLAMLAYEGGIVTPLLILFWELLQRKKRLGWTMLFLLQVPAYIAIRTFAGAHGLAGDYSYNFIKLPANALGNLLGYFMLMTAGPRLAEPWFSTLRFIARSNVLLFIIVAVLVAISLSVFLYIAFKRKQISTTSKLALGYIVISLLPFLGLGNISMRYSYLAGPGFAIFATAGLAYLYKRVKKFNYRFAKFLAVGIFVTFVGYNMHNLQEAHKDWHTAGKIAQDALLAVKQEYFPLTVPYANFYFVNVPIRYGLAWVFPVGLDDAIWHSFRNPRLKIYTANTVGEAFNQAEGKKNVHIFLFRQNKLEEVSTKTVEFEKEFRVIEEVEE